MLTYRDGEIFAIDTETYDLRDSRVVKLIADDVRAAWRPEQAASQQIDLFESGDMELNLLNQVREQSAATILRVISSTRTIASSQNDPRVIQRRQETIVAYLAAPFTSVASPTVESAKITPSLFADTRNHGVIGKGGFRNALLSIERALGGYGISTWIPHRDTNRWGYRTMTPGQVAHECSYHVYASDLVICLLGTSLGAHYELGIARGLGKPVVLLVCDELPSSFMGQGIEQGDWPDTLVIRSSRLKDLGKMIRHINFLNFVVRYFQIQVNQANEETS
jgi:deoxyadenosine/deoxycytidine kinase